MVYPHIVAQTHVQRLSIFILQAYVFVLHRGTISLHKSSQSQNVLSIEDYLGVEDSNQAFELITNKGFANIYNKEYPRKIDQLTKDTQRAVATYV